MWIGMILAIQDVKLTSISTEVEYQFNGKCTSYGVVPGLLLGDLRHIEAEVIIGFTIDILFSARCVQWQRHAISLD